jgi:NAD(P)-dependent dehydrogenase (short-subunit alcohol dehydrogenase family)
MVGHDGVDEIARSTADALAREGATHLRDDPLSEAAHDFERVLTAFLARLVLVRSSDGAQAAIERAKKTLDAERFLRDGVLEGLSAEALLSQQVNLMFRRVWTSQTPWSVDGLTKTAAKLRQALTELPPPGPVRIGQIGNANYEMHLLHDPLTPGTFDVIREVADSRVISSDDPVHLRERQEFAVALLHNYFPERTEQVG